MAPLPISLEAQEIGPLGPGTEYNFPTRPGPPMPRAHHPASPAGVPDVEDVFVVAVSLVVVASLTIFVVYQAIGALKEMMDTRPSPFSALSITSFRKHGWNSIGSSEGEQLPLLCPSNISIDSDGCRRNSRWVGEHRCQFTLSPDPYESDTSSTLTRSSSDSTVVGGRVCVVYDDTIETEGESDEEESEEGSEEEEEEKSQYRRPMYEPRTRVRRQAIFST